MVGDGVARLVERAFAARGRCPDPEAVADFSADYAAHAAVESRPYPGVITALRELGHDGWRLGVCTNKPEAAAGLCWRRSGWIVALARSVAATASRCASPTRVTCWPRLRRWRMSRAGGDGGDHVNDVAAATGRVPASSPPGAMGRGDGTGCCRGGAGFRRVGGDRPAAAEVALPRSMRSRAAARGPPHQDGRDQSQQQRAAHEEERVAIGQEIRLRPHRTPDRNHRIMPGRRRIGRAGCHEVPLHHLQPAPRRLVQQRHRWSDDGGVELLPLGQQRLQAPRCRQSRQGCASC